MEISTIGLDLAKNIFQIRAGLIARSYGWIGIPNPGLLKDSFG